MLNILATKFPNVEYSCNKILVKIVVTTPFKVTKYIQQK